MKESNNLLTSLDYAKDLSDDQLIQIGNILGLKTIK